MPLVLQGFWGRPFNRTEVTPADSLGPSLGLACINCAQGFVHVDVPAAQAQCELRGTDTKCSLFAARVVRILQLVNCTPRAPTTAQALCALSVRQVTP